MSDQVSEGWLSPWLRRRRFRAALPFIHGRLLDVGCGVGELAGASGSQSYEGVEIDRESRRIAQRNHPQHPFHAGLDGAGRDFDTVAALAVIEHVPDPAEFLRDLASHLGPHGSARIVVTTPHPRLEWVHGLGASLGLFSRSASEEHEQLLDRRALAAIGRQAGLELETYRRFLWGANQLAVYRRVEA